jgi:hypothetical protein
MESIKQLEGKVRLDGLKPAERSRADALAQQTRASLVGGARKWRITNLKQAAMVMATWRQSRRAQALSTWAASSIRGFSKALA